MSTAAVVSIGYEGRTPAEFVALLVAHRITKVIDVRELPLSRRKGFSKTPLSAKLKSAGIDYCHVRAAGNPHRHLKADTARCLAMYTAHLKKHPEVVQLVGDELLSGRVAVLCFERAHAACHRSRLLDAVSRSQRVQVVRVE
ncbi:MAG TPA: DUF488 domain-containing protein [Vicinamibacterales bacterium]|jgi:uncharacterized protein (DUF488 family)